ncbi:very short patch repair endonuclease [Mesorhizobium sp. NPDC059025]|uniref:very short patch repair endonuclease n=1 Tax=unclassified Mesorhizobium TaxID=325217 RepID=UPI0036C70FE2
MADIVPPDVRSRMMSGIRGKNTKPELVIRKGLHAIGFRFRLHVKALPGKPDLVLPKYRAALFVHGCFWHGHNCHLFRLPSTRQDFWLAKVDGNKQRDALAESHLVSEGWRVGAIWECALRGRNALPFEDVIELCAHWLKSDAPLMEIRGRDEAGNALGLLYRRGGEAPFDG